MFVKLLSPISMPLPRSLKVPLSLIALLLSDSGAVDLIVLSFVLTIALPLFCFEQLLRCVVRLRFWLETWTCRQAFQEQLRLGLVLAYHFFYHYLISACNSKKNLALFDFREKPYIVVCGSDPARCMEVK